jgi:hypothetical protein
MLLLVLAVVVGVGVGLAAGGRLRHLDTHPVAWPWLLVVGAVLEAVAGHWHLPGGSTWATIAGGVCLLGFALRNLVLTGMGIVAAGLLANIAVIGIDHGMPVDPGAVVSAGIASPIALPAVRYGPTHHRQTAGDHLVALDDRLPVPWGHLILSLGDVVLAVGIADVAAHLLQPRPRYAYQARRWRPEPSDGPPQRRVPL